MFIVVVQISCKTSQKIPFWNQSEKLPLCQKTLSGALTLLPSHWCLFLVRGGEKTGRAPPTAAKTGEKKKTKKQNCIHMPRLEHKLAFCVVSCQKPAERVGGGVRLSVLWWISSFISSCFRSASPGGFQAAALLCSFCESTKCG